MALEQITTDYDQIIPQSKLKSMQSAKERADNVAQGKMLDKTVVSPAQMKADVEADLKKKRLARLAMLKASAEKINPYAKK